MVTITGLASNRGRNLRNVTDHTSGGAEFGVVVSNSADASVLDWVNEHNIPSGVVERGDDEARKPHEERILDALTGCDFDLVCLDGYMRALTSTFLDAAPTTLNVHPSLLPVFPGMGAHEQILDTGVKTTGYTVHVVNEEAGVGPIVTQEVVSVYTNDNADDLKSRVLYDTEFKAYPHTVRWLAEGRVAVEDDSVTVEGDIDAGLPERRVTSEDRYGEPRYDESPHRDTTVCVDETCDETSAVGAPQLNEGAKGLSYNNYNDTDGALNIIKEFDEPAMTIIKHTDPAGCVIADTLVEVYADALATDPISIFGGIVALNRECDTETAELVIDSFKEIVVAPGYTGDALDVLTKKKNLRVFNVGDLGERTKTYTEKALVGGRLVRERNLWTSTLEGLEVVTETEPTDEQLETMLFAWTMLKHVKSDDILFARGTETVGVGMGQVSRVDAVELATMEAGEHAKGRDAQSTVVASDAFFPFPNGVEKTADVGIEAVIQPGDSMDGEDVIAACNERGIAMVFTGQRCFRHD